MSDSTSLIHSCTRSPSERKCFRGRRSSRFIAPCVKAVASLRSSAAWRSRLRSWVRKKTSPLSEKPSSDGYGAGCPGNDLAPRAEKQFRDEVGLQLARVSREVETLTASAHSDIEARVIENKAFTANVPLSVPHAPFGAATMDDADRPQRTMPHIRFAAGVVGAWLLICGISFLVAGGLIRRTQVGDGKLPTPNTSGGLPSQKLNSAPHIDSPAAFPSERQSSHQLLGSGATALA